MEIYRKPTLIQLFFAAPNYFFLLFPYPAETIHPEIHTAFLFFAKSSEIIKELHTLPLRIDDKMSLINLHTFFPVLSNILSVHTAHLTSHSFHLIISWISLRFTHKIPRYPGKFPFVSKNPKQLNICFFCSSFSLSPYSCGNLLPFQHQFYLTITTIQ